MTWNFGESPPTIVMVQIYIRVCMYYGYDMGKNCKVSCSCIVPRADKIIVCTHPS